MRQIKNSFSNTSRILLCVAMIAMLSVSCSEKRPQHIIGVSQCSEDIWRHWQNSEMQMEQIDSLVESGIDLLIVAPNQLSSVSPAIDRAYDKGIPVIVFERKTDSQKYTAFVSADNYEMGHQMGEYVVSRLNGKGRVMEILGLKGSSPAQERHDGFTDALKDSGVEVVATIQGDWTEPTAYEAVKAYKGDLQSIDLVFGHNDRSAMGARKAFLERGAQLPLFCGIDGLPGENGGIRQVQDSLLEASYIYPTRGDQLLQIALAILDGRPYEKETMLTSALVTHENAKVLLLESDEVMRQAQNLEKLQEQASGYLQQLATQRTITLLALVLIALLLLVLVLFTLYHRGKVEPEEQDKESGESSDDVQEPLFIVHFKKVVEARLSDSDLSVDDLASAMNLSRVQLYRKVKSISGSSPVELLRTARLNRGYQLLLTSGKNVSEVAYEVGFTAPSYFTKCFKDEFGVSPSDLQAK